MLTTRQGTRLHCIAGCIFIATLVVNLFSSHGQLARAGASMSSAAHAPLVLAPLVLAPAGVVVSAGPQAGGTLLGAVLFSTFGSTSTASADIYLGVVPTNTTPVKNRVNLYHNSSTPSAGVKSGDCAGDWDKDAPNTFALEYQPATSDRLTVTLANTRVVSDVNCTLVFSDFTHLVSNTLGVAAARLAPLMNYLEVSIKRNSANYTSTLANLTLNDSIALGAFNPITTTTAISHVSSFHLGAGFRLAGEIDLSGSFGNCAGTCEIEIRFGAAPAQIVVQQQVSGHTPASDWQFSGPNGAFSLPVMGGSTVITPLGSNTHAITQTAKAGFSTSAACSNGANGNESVSVTPGAGESITCTFTSAALPSDLSISKRVVSDSVQVDSTITYALVVSNVGTGPAYNAIITDSVPPSLTAVSAQSDAGTCAIDNNAITCNAGFINTWPISTPFSVIVTATAPGDLSAIGMTLTNTAGVTDALDATPANNFAERAITLRAVDAGQIVVRNVVSGALPASGAFGYALQTPSGTTPFTLSAGSSISFTGMATGAHVVSATATLGYATEVDCDGNAGTFTLVASGTATCTFIHAGNNVITGTLWHDRNDNQQADAEEWRLPQVTLALSGALAGGSLSAITTTGNNGQYQFAGLPEGAYVVMVLSETLPAGVVTPTFDADNVDTPNSAQTALCCNAPARLDFGYRGDGRIGGRAFFDMDNDGALSAGDLPLANLVAQLTGDLNSDTVMDMLTTTTNSAGGYAFTSILSGGYTLTVDAASLPAGLHATTPASAVVTLDEAPLLDVNFGFRGTGRIAGLVWEDVNGDGGLDVMSTLASAGDYVFDGLVAGAYTITVDAVSLPPAMQRIAQTWQRAVTLALDETKAGVDFGLVRPASVRGRVWLDANRNGAQDEGERGLNGVEASLFAADNNSALTVQSIAANPIATTTSDAGGEYRFDQLAPGRPYSLNLALPAGFTWVMGDASAIDPSGNTGIFTTTSGAEAVLSMDAGATQPTRMILRKTTAQTMLGPDERITYTLVIRNAGETLAAQTLISDPLPSALQFVSAAPWPSMAPADGAPLVWAVGDLPAGQSFTVTLVTQRKQDGALAGNSIVNTAYVLADMQTVLRTADLQSSATTMLQPTAITLAAFNAALQGDGVQLIWHTALEQNIFGFNVLRSASGQRSGAVQVNAQVITAAGVNNDYRLTDGAGALNNVYWLQEMDLSGATTDFGPFRVSAPAAFSQPVQQPVAPGNGAVAPAGGMMIAQPAIPQAQVAVSQPQAQWAAQPLQDAPAQPAMTAPMAEPVTVKPVESAPALPAPAAPMQAEAAAEAQVEAAQSAMTQSAMAEPARADEAQAAVQPAMSQAATQSDVAGMSSAVGVARGGYAITPAITHRANNTTADAPNSALPMAAAAGAMVVLAGVGVFTLRRRRK